MGVSHGWRLQVNFHEKYLYDRPTFVLALRSPQKEYCAAVTRDITYGSAILSALWITILPCDLS